LFGKESLHCLVARSLQDAVWRPSIIQGDALADEARGVHARMQRSGIDFGGLHRLDNAVRRGGRQLYLPARFEGYASARRQRVSL
jgi:hypothetical protein